MKTTRFTASDPQTGNEIRIYRIEAKLLPHLNGFVHLVLGDTFPPILIDAGSGELNATEEILDGLAQVATIYGEHFSPSDVELILLTHAHIDHFGGCNALARELKAKVGVHRFDARIIGSYSERAAVGSMLYRSFLLEQGVEPSDIDPIIQGFGFIPGRVRATSVDLFLEGGEQIGPLRVHHFPGHSAGHVLFEAGNLLIGGDLILSQTLTQIWPERIMPQTGLIRYLESIDRLQHLLLAKLTEGKVDSPQLQILPGHEDPITEPLKRIELIKKTIKRRENRLLTILRAAPEPMNCFELSKKLYFTTHINRTFFAICDTAARLEYLQLYGKLTAVNYDQLSPEHPAVRYGVLDN